MRLDHITPKQSDRRSEREEDDAENGRVGSQDPRRIVYFDHRPNWASQAASSPGQPTELLDEHRALEPPDPFPNSEVKRCIADGSVGFPHVRVGHRQAPNTQHPRSVHSGGGVVFGAGKVLAGVPRGMSGGACRRKLESR